MLPTQTHQKGNLLFSMKWEDKFSQSRLHQPEHSNWEWNDAIASINLEINQLREGGWDRACGLVYLYKLYELMYDQKVMKIIMLLQLCDFKGKKTCIAVNY